MVMEVVTTVADNGTVNFTRIYRTEPTTVPVHVGRILTNIPAYRFIFKDPLDLQKLFEDPARASIAICKGMKKLHLDLLQALTDVELTKREEEIGDPTGPNTGPLLANWRNACRAIPKDHAIEELIFDVSCANKDALGPWLTKRLIQLLSTTMMIKAKGDLRCVVQGLGDLTELKRFVVSR
ncbi:hypothetical protein ETB97_000877 [Aspergillus alliaceus]|uniref:Uncharacterized protein n=1 Tax=Petromyces alliaceus TaxID=209559 RepID=A0A5N7CGW1_PETAA|nr:uncharacterized protein BDW43DRAFT_312147 [Aspergillus alliaceus]KAB8232474.1 hypothetical protein BDW43DRAFT_312147 [Aspergillus alliaceus]KAE8393406.1 hypothetical protein BDV23DRAFT_180737 [Aspergillus alliaceus]KAF5860967.1 hypothetical protein ETB97_000877 [Aspergillus burnettii]